MGKIQESRIVPARQLRQVEQEAVAKCRHSRLRYVGRNVGVRCERCGAVWERRRHLIGDTVLVMVEPGS